jgi:large subunit ribosomal protein L7/L12
MAELKQMAEAIANLTIKEAIELANILKDEYGIEPAAAAVAVAAAPGAAGPAAEAEQTQFDVILTSAGQQNSRLSKWSKRSRIWTERTKELVDGAPKAVKEKPAKQKPNRSNHRLKKPAEKLKLNKLYSR